MNSKEFNELVAMLAVIYKKIDNVEKKVINRSTRSASLQTYLDELRNEASELFVK